MSIFEQMNKMVSEEIRRDEDEKIDYILYGKIPEYLKCFVCRERARETDRNGIGFNIEPGQAEK